MLDQLLNLVKEHAGESIINNPAIPNERNEEAISVAGNSIMNILKSQATNGNMSAITDMFSNGNIGNSSLANSTITNVAGELMQKFGMDQSQANSIASSLIPQVLNAFVSKTNDPSDSSFDLNDIVSTLGGGKAGGLLGNVMGMFGR